MGRRHFFTLNDPCGLIDFDDLYSRGATYLLYQEEVGEDEGRHHFQGIIHFNKSVRCDTVAKWLAEGQDGAWPKVFLEIHGEKYVTKEDTRVGGPYEHGHKKKQGERSDIHAYHADVKAGMAMNDLWDKHVGCSYRFNRMAMEYRRQQQKPRTEPPHVTVIIGPNDKGKSSFAQDLGLPIYRHNMGEPGWWDNYHNEPVVFLDEFRGQIPIEEMNQLLDRYPQKVKVKGCASQEFNSPHVFITSNYPLDKWYPYDDMNAFKSRITRYLVYDPVDEFFVDHTSTLPRRTFKKARVGAILTKDGQKIPIPDSSSSSSSAHVSPQEGLSVSTSSSNLEEPLDRCP